MVCLIATQYLPRISALNKANISPNCKVISQTATLPGAPRKY